MEISPASSHVLVPPKTRTGERRFGLSICCLSATLSSFLALVATSRYGVGVDTDAVTYLSVTHGLLHGDGFTVYNGTPFVAQPPLFPLVLALLARTGLSPADAARCLNSALFGVVSALTTLWLLKNVRLRGLALLGGATIVLAKPLLGVSVFAWSEPLFVLCSLLFMYFLAMDGEREGFLPLALCVFFASLACLIRYIGLSVVLTGCLVLLTQRRRSTVRGMLTAGSFLIAALFPLGAWCARSYFLTSTLFGPRAPSTMPLKLHVFTATASVSVWFLPGQIPFVVRAATLAGVSVLLLWVILRFGGRENPGHGTRPGNMAPILPLLWFAPVFFLCSLLAATRLAVDLLDDRLLSPLFVPFVLLACFSIDNIDWRLPATTSEIWKRIILLAFALWLIYPLVSTARRIQRSLRDGAGALCNNVGFTRPRWLSSDLIAYVRHHSFDGLIYSNYPDPIWLFTGVTAIQTPPKFHYNSRQRLSRSVRQFQETIGRHRTAYFVWFDEPTRPFLYDVSELRSFVPMSVLVRCSDGVIYRTAERKTIARGAGTPR